MAGGWDWWQEGRQARSRAWIISYAGLKLLFLSSVEKPEAAPVCLDIGHLHRWLSPNKPIGTSAVLPQGREEASPSPGSFAAVP